MNCPLHVLVLTALDQPQCCCRRLDGVRTPEGTHLCRLLSIVFPLAFCICNSPRLEEAMPPLPLPWTPPFLPGHRDLKLSRSKPLSCFCLLFCHSNGKPSAVLGNQGTLPGARVLEEASARLCFCLPTWRNPSKVPRALAGEGTSLSS